MKKLFLIIAISCMAKNMNAQPYDYGYLFCFMNSQTEITNFALGTKADRGTRFNVLINGNPVFDVTSTTKEGGTRDSFIARGREGGPKYLMVTTDMCQHSSGKWENHGIDLLRSNDLIHWMSKTFDFRTGKKLFSDYRETVDIFPTNNEYALIYRVWAPQIIWDKEAEKWMVYYSILSSANGDSYDKIYYSYADSTFKTLTQPRVLIDLGCSTIDADIVYCEKDRKYHCFLKRTTGDSRTTGNCQYVSDKLVGGEWKETLFINENEPNCEAPTLLKLIGEDVWNLYFMRYSNGVAYKYLTLNNRLLNPSNTTPLQGNGSFQHGSMMTVSELEYKMLELWSQAYLKKAEIEKIQAVKRTAEEKALFMKIRSAMNKSSVEALYEAFLEVDSMITSINGIEADSPQFSNQATFDFNGRKLFESSTPQRGLFIKGGKKYFVK